MALASQVFGSLESFEPKVIEWEIYETKFEFFLAANLITDVAQMKALLLSSLGAVALSFVKSVNLPNSLHDAGITCASLLVQLREHYGKKVAVLAARHEFVNVK